MSMKRTSRILSLALAIVLVVSCMGIQAFAADESNVKQYGQVDKDGYGGYLAIGDSIARGMGVQDYADNGMQSIFYKWECRNVPGSYPYIIAKAVGCNTPESINDASGNFWPCCYPGMTTTEVVDLIGIEDNYYDEAFRQIHSRYKNQAVPYFGCEETVDGLGTSGTAGNIRDLCQRASLITIGLGMGDVLFRAKELAFREESTLDKVTTMVKEMYAGFEQWKISYPILIDYLQEVNPEATIVLTGAVNFSLNLTLTDDSLLPVADALSVIFTQMNWYIRQLASEKGCLYADFSNTEVAATQYEWSITGEWGDNTNLSTHPTPEGNEYMARQILTQLPEQQPVEDVLSKTDICVDLGRFKNVKSVVLDGKTVTGYSTDGYKLIVKNDSKDALLLTVTVTDENNVTNVLVYQLTYHDGYTAYRVYGVSATKVRSVVSARVTSIKDTVMSLFKK